MKKHQFMNVVTIISILLSTLLIGCGSGVNLPDTNQGCITKSVSASKDHPNGGALITCGSTTTYVENGSSGANGANGLSIVASVVPDESGKCVAGGSVILMAQDSQGTGLWSPKDTGQSAVLVCNGANGSNGTNGTNGSNGTNGTNATPVTSIQFCSGITNYPSSFPEFGLCLSNSIYAVYWDGHNAWLAMIVPGYYASTSTSAPCNFTVGANCAIVH